MENYSHIYYLKNKDKIKEQTKKAYQNRSIMKLIKKLNSDVEFERFPYARLKKLGIIYDIVEKKYYKKDS
jgi:hypothetical protein